MQNLPKQKKKKSIKIMRITFERKKIRMVKLKNIQIKKLTQVKKKKTTTTIKKIRIKFDKIEN
jgi:hypothetical protein